MPNTWKGFHSITLTQDSGKYFVSVSTQQFYLGLYQQYCQSCNALNKFPSGKGQMFNNFKLPQYSFVFQDKSIIPVSNFGQVIKDGFNVYFKQFNRTSNLSVSFLGMTNQIPSMKQS
jgi:hypothetical protein